MQLETHNKRFSINLWKQQNLPGRSGSELTHRQSLPHRSLWCGSKQWASYPESHRVVVLCPSPSIRGVHPSPALWPPRHFSMQQMMQRVFAKSCSPPSSDFFPQRRSWGIWPAEWKWHFFPAFPGCFGRPDSVLGIRAWTCTYVIRIFSSLPPICCDPLPFELRVFFEVLSKSLFLRSPLWYVCNLWYFHHLEQGCQV